MQKNKINPEVVSHIITGSVVLLKGIDKITHYNKPIIGSVLLAIGIFITLLGFFHHQIEKHITNVKSIILLSEAIVMGIIGYLYLCEGKIYIQYACFMASLGFLIVGLINLYKSDNNNQKEKHTNKYSVLNSAIIGIISFSCFFCIKWALENYLTLSFSAFLNQIIFKIIMAILSIFIGVLLFKIPKAEFSLLNNKKEIKQKPFIISALLLGSIATASMLLFKLPPIPLLKQMNPFEIIISVWFFSTICEEIFCRGFIQNVVKEEATSINFLNTNISKPVIVGALIFSLMHIGIYVSGGNLYTTINTVLFTFLLGIVCGILKEKNGLLSAIWGHLAFNIGGVIMAVILKIVTN